MSPVVRWTFDDGQEVWELLFNPDNAGSPFLPRSIRTAHGPALVSGGGLSRHRMFQEPRQPVGWEFGGPIRSQDHHDSLLYWSKKPREVLVSDHLGRTFEVMMEGIEFTDRRPTPDRPWRLNYTMRTLVLRRTA